MYYYYLYYIFLRFELSALNRFFSDSTNNNVNSKNNHENMCMRRRHSNNVHNYIMTYDNTYKYALTGYCNITLVRITGIF